MASAALADQEGERPFDRLSKRHFDRLASYIYDYSGIRMPPSKLTMLEGRLRRRLRATGHHSLDAYCDFLFKEDGIQSESVQLIDAVTTNKTPAGTYRGPGRYEACFFFERMLDKAAARLGSFRAAANEMGITRSAVSHQVKLLEDGQLKPWNGNGA